MIHLLKCLLVALWHIHDYHPVSNLKVLHLLDADYITVAEEQLQSTQGKLLLDFSSVTEAEEYVIISLLIYYMGPSYSH